MELLTQKAGVYYSLVTAGFAIGLKRGFCCYNTSGV